MVAPGQPAENGPQQQPAAIPPPALARPGPARPREPDHHRRAPGGTRRIRTARRLPVPAAGPPPWSLARTGDPGPPGGYGTWTLTLPDGRRAHRDLEPVPTLDCDHRHESHAYQPSDTLRHLVQVRDGDCTFPPCSRHAREVRLRARHSLRQGRPYLQLQRRRSQSRLPPGKAVTRLDRHPAKTRLAPMANPGRPHLHPGTKTLSGLIQQLILQPRCVTLPASSLAWPGPEGACPVALCRACPGRQRRALRAGLAGLWRPDRARSPVGVDATGEKPGKAGCGRWPAAAWDRCRRKRRGLAVAALRGTGYGARPGAWPIAGRAVPIATGSAGPGFPPWSASRRAAPAARTRAPGPATPARR